MLPFLLCELDAVDLDATATDSGIAVSCFAPK